MTGTCEVCGNQYDKAFEVIAAGAHHVFDSFECAIQSWRRTASSAAATSSGTGSRPAGGSTAARIARTSPGRRDQDRV